MRIRRRVLSLALLACGLSGCSGWQSALDPQGPQAQHLATIIWSFTLICAVVWVLVIAALVIGLMRPHPARFDPLATDSLRERRALLAIGAATAATLVILLVLTGISYVSQKRLFTKQEAKITISLTGHQWWWEVQYDDPKPDRTFITANEIHIPVGEPIAVKLKSADVIHSFWVPSLAGKLDLIPGQDNELQFVASRPGSYRGQCAEFCGWQHAHMGLLVIASPRDEFEQWRDAQIKPAEPIADAEQQKGQQTFLSKPCIMCHSVRGTPAGGRIGPDLTHLGSRKYIAAATLPMSRGNLAAWIVDPHGIKPGVNMPLMKIEPEELDPLVSYLTSLK